MLKYLTPVIVGFLAAALIDTAAYSATTASAGEWHTPTSEQKCLADNIYWEARNQPPKGMIGVALVTRNRVRDSRFPHSYCEVVQQGPTKPSWKDINVDIPIRHRCQFSWYCDGNSDDIPYYDLDVYEFARTIAFKIYHGHIEDFTLGSTHYHATYVTPEWADTKTFIINIDEHIFYRWEK